MECQSFVGRFGLTRREAEVANLVTLGNSNANIAKQLGITVPTVKVHLVNIRKKAKTRNRIELVRLAFGDL